MTTAQPPGEETMAKMPSLRLTEVRRGDAWVLEIDGEVDHAEADKLAAAVHRLTAHAGPLIIDLAGLSFIDSSGIRALYAAHTNAIEIGLSLTITRPQGAPLRPFVIAGLEAQLFGEQSAERKTPLGQPENGQ